MKKQILFYNTTDIPYGCFSNFSPHGFFEEDENGEKHYWRTSEHFFQAYKYVHNKPYFDMIKHARTPKDAAKLGRNKELPYRNDWELDLSPTMKVKDEVMYRALYLKFTSHHELERILRETGNAHIIEDSPIDWYWGWGKDHTGKNKLGILLMKLRDALNED